MKRVVIMRGFTPEGFLSTNLPENICKNQQNVKASAAQDYLRASVKQARRACAQAL